LEQFQKAMAAVPAQAEPKALAAHANFLLKNYSGALALYQAALALDRGNPLYYKRIGLVYRAIGDLAGARESFRKYLEMEPDATDRAEFEKFL
jgi:tetratricopeptide (TPR) repeat protein